MSRYVRDDKQFRASIAKLADAGLRLDRSIKTAQATIGEFADHAKAHAQSAPPEPRAISSTSFLRGHVFARGKQWFTRYLISGLTVWAAGLFGLLKLLGVV